MNYLVININEYAETHCSIVSTRGSFLCHPRIYLGICTSTRSSHATKADQLRQLYGRTLIYLSNLSLAHIFHDPARMKLFSLSIHRCNALLYPSDQKRPKSPL